MYKVTGIKASVMSMACTSSAELLLQKDILSHYSLSAGEKHLRNPATGKQNFCKNVFKIK
jgi:hypothetical protein